MKKKISIILIIIFLILVSVLLTISIYKKNDKYSQTYIYEFAPADGIKNNNKEENILENTVLEESTTILGNKEMEKGDTVENKTENQNTSEKNNKINNKVVNEETTTHKNTTQTVSKNEEKQESIVVEESKEDIVKDNEKTSTDKPPTNNTKTEEIIETPKCKHSNENYYNTEEEAIAFYKKISKEYGDKVKNGEITYEEYLKKCPYGYETMSCPYCEKWTISFYYE